MKYFFFLSLVLSALATNAQTVYTSKKDVAAAKEIIFYGYDFRYFRLADPKRLEAYDTDDPAGIKVPLNNKLKAYASAWVGYLLDKITNKEFARDLKKSKVTFDFDYTLQGIRELSDSDHITPVKTSIPPDSIQTILNNYQVKQKEGIGFTVIVNCFNKETETSSAYFVFFDIATKKVLMSNYYRTNHANGIGLTKHWGYGFYRTVNAYIGEEYRVRIKGD